MNNITLIIPFNDEIEDICNLLNKLENWTLYPDEIILINSSKKETNNEIQNFHPIFANKNITTGEGGMITTNNENIYKKLKIIRNQGQEGRYNHTFLGNNFRKKVIFLGRTK